MNTQQILDKARLWADYHAQVQAQRTLVRLEAERALEQLKAALVPVRVGGEVAWRVLPLGPADVPALTAVSHAVTMAPVTAEVDAAIEQLAEAVPEALADVDAVAGARRMVATPAAKADAQDAVEFLTEYVEWGDGEGIVATLKALEPEAAPEGITPADALAPHVGLAAIWRKLGTAELVAAPTGVGSGVAADDVAALRTALAAKQPTHLAVFSTESRSAEGLLAVLQA
ncbi:hypothetical protein Xcel_0683 [Xylanimonas cellulosilytica DSM 15894]|uniref:Uncharacterized protein n=1 Tax=Xylanimonas cellulosilytica (strain DSM 15894 / JCM 12276 / CECT 5975 / KCTC 9989 / LMG 20990 / NBRC 107835 / XIL07) TaxID=446471 RepID=D1BXB2_XYLCX|nr:hypothetical protein [Xylanimonas cellulosilytica]ACZ29722.1 hypothetical protein Xcel_0683 [Xylanimonas cellulosilytica DSM 15894]